LGQVDRALYPLRRSTKFEFPKSGQPIQITSGSRRFNIGELSKIRAEMRAEAKERPNKQQLAKVEAKIKSALKKNTLQELEELGNDPTFRQLVNEDPKSARALVTELRNNFSNAKYKNKSTAEKDAYFNKRVNEMKVKYDWRFKEGGQLPKYQIGGLLGEAIRTNLSPILDLSSALLQNRDISRSYDYLHDANAERKKRQFIAPQVQLPTFNSSSIEQKYNAAKNPLLNTKLTYNDSMLNLAGKLALSEQMSNLEAQKGTELSDYTSRYNDARLNALNQISQINANVANEQSAYITNVNALDEQLKANELNEKWSNIWNTYSQQVRQDLRTKHDTVKSYNLDNQISELQKEQSLAKKNALSSLYEQYDASGSTLRFEDWLTRTPSAYKQYLEIQEGKEWRDMIQKQHKAYNDLLIKNIYAKQGTKLTEREKLVIQGDKAAKEAVKDMNKNLTQLLLKLMK